MLRLQLAVTADLYALMDASGAFSLQRCASTAVHFFSMANPRYYNENLEMGTHLHQKSSTYSP